MAFVQQPPDDLTLNKYSLEYPYAELQQATQNFDARCKLGSGAFGAVYRGIQQDGTEVAVKVLEMPLEAGFEEEVRVLSKFRHPNLVILMGFARYGLQRFLVYELLEGGDVYRRLQRSNSEGVPFLWNQRISAAFDAACGLSHLHNATPKVFHRDIKSANILLNRNGTAKMADFGLACLSDAKEHKVKTAAGTVGYACPIYAKRSVVTEGSEVYSFGVVLLEMLTSSPSAWIVNDSEGSQRYEFLVSHIRGDLCTAMAFADPEAYWPQQVACVIVDTALRCVQHDESQRPCFSEIVNILRQHLHSKETNSRGMQAPSVRPRLELQGPPRLRSPTRQPVHAAVQAPRTPVRENATPQHALPCQPGPLTVLQGVSAAPRASPLLWSLECTFTEGLGSVASIPREKRTIVHRPEPGTPMLAPFKVGRRWQEEFFASMVLKEENFTMISREHFQIWATQVFYTNAPPIEAAAQSVPCAFFLANLSRTWTTVNGALLDGCGKSVRLHHGDCIAIGRRVQTPECVRYAPFLQFRFDLSGSLLQDDDVPEASECEGLTALAPPCASVRKGTPLAGDVVPLFLLRLEGRGVRAGPASESRVIVHGPLSETPMGVAFLPLVLGRGHHSWFWERVLSSEALAALAWEHVVFEACGGEDCVGEGAAGVAVRSLDNERPLRVGAGEGPRTLEVEERRLLRHGDVVVLVPDPACSVWLSFRDLRAAGPFKTCTIGVATPTRAGALARGF